MLNQFRLNWRYYVSLLVLDLIFVTVYVFGSVTNTNLPWFVQGLFGLLVIFTYYYQVRYATKKYSVNFAISFAGNLVVSGSLVILTIGVLCYAPFAISVLQG